MGGRGGFDFWQVRDAATLVPLARNACLFLGRVELMPGPIPGPPQQRRQPGRGLAGGRLTHLPVGGRKGKPPAWPLPVPSKRERELWARLWRTPQASAWENGGTFADVVARYVRLSVLTETKPTAMVLQEVRHLEDRLGLNSLALARLRWTVADDTKPELAVLDIRDRLRAVDSETPQGEPLT